MSSAKKFLFYLLLFAMPLVFLGTAEIVLRWAVPDSHSPLVRETSMDGIEWYEINRDYLRRFFPGEMKEAPEFKTGYFRKNKAGAFRAFCLGGSSMFGTPYLISANIPGIVRKQLRAMYPDREIEVINLAASAINSFVVKDLSRKIIGYQPDLVLIYMGHNEFYGPEGVGASAIEKRIPQLTGLKYRLGQMRIYQVLSRFLAAEQESEDDSESLMQRVSRGNRVVLDSPESRRVLKNFRRNLADILEIFQEKEIPVIVSRVVSNLKFMPFDYEKEISGENSDSLAAEIKNLIEQDRPDIAETMIERKLNADSTHALLLFWKAEALLARGRQDLALKYFVSARDNDLLKFRAPGAINEIIGDVTAEFRVPIVAADSLFTALCPDGIPDEKYFWEHLHPNLQGYCQIARLFVAKINQLDLPGRRPAIPGFLCNAEQLDICWLDFAFADLSLQHITGNWPFTGLRFTPAYLHKYDEVLRQIAVSVHEGDIPWDKGCYQTAAHFRKLGEYPEALRIYRTLADEFPSHYYPRYLAANLLQEQGNLAAARQYYLQSIGLKPDHPHSKIELGLLLVNLGEFDLAIGNFSDALQLQSVLKNSSLQANAWYGLGVAYANKQNFPAALLNINKALERQPGHPAAAELKKQIEKLVKE